MGTLPLSHIEGVVFVVVVVVVVVVLILAVIRVVVIPAGGFSGHGRF